MGRSARSSRSSSPLPTSEFDPAYPPNLKRSLARNDVELAALSKLHIALRSLRKAIVEEFGEDALLEAVVSEKQKIPSGEEEKEGGGEKKSVVVEDDKEDDKKEEKEKEAATENAEDETTNKNNETISNPPNQKRLQQLTSAFLLRMTLRRRLLNRLARRLHRVSHIMDSSTTSSSISAPLPPLYGDVARRYITEESEKDGLALKVMGSLSNVKLVREGDVKSFEKRERMLKGVKGELEEQRRKRRAVVAAAGQEKEDVKDDGSSSVKDGEDEAKDDEATGEEKDAIEQEKDAPESMDEENDEKSMEGEEKSEPESMDVDEETPTEKESETEETTSTEPPVSDANADREEDATPNEVDLLLQGDQEDKPLLDQLTEYELGYDKVYSIGPLPPLPPPSTAAASPAKNTDAKLSDGDDKPGDANNSSDDADEAMDVKEAEDEAPSSPTVDADTAAADAAAAPTEEKTEASAPSPNDNNASSEPIKEKQVLKVSMPIAFTTDDHEVNEDGDFVSNTIDPASSRIPFSLHSAPIRILHPKERSVEWKRWTKEMCEKIPDQVTFDELGVGGVGCVFDLEGSLKRKREDGDKDDQKEEKGPGEEDVAANNRGKGKVLRKSSPEKAEKKSDDDAEKDGDVKMDEADESKKVKFASEDETGENTTKDNKDSKKKSGTENTKNKAATTTTKTFSLTPVPSFHYQDLKRIRIIQNEMVNYRNVMKLRERVMKAQSQYDVAYKRSIDLQQAKSSTVMTFNKLIEKYKRETEAMENQRKRQFASAKIHWERRQAQIKDMESKLGKEEALVREVSNNVLQDLKDRVTIRTAEELQGSGLGTHRLKKIALKAKSDGNESKEVAATMLGHMLDSVERRHEDVLANNPVFVPPKACTAKSVIADPKTGETTAQAYARDTAKLKQRLAQLDVAFKKAERERGEAWMALSKTKTGGQSGAQSSAASKSKQSRRPRQSAGSSSSSARVVAAAASNAGLPVRRQQPVGYPMQMQTAQQQQPRQVVQPRPAGPRTVPLGYVPSSYYQRPTGATNPAASSAANLMVAQLAASAGYPAMAVSAAGAQITQIARAHMAQQQQRPGSVVQNMGPTFYPVPIPNHPNYRPLATPGVVGVPTAADTSNLNQGVQHATAAAKTTAAAQLVAQLAATTAPPQQHQQPPQPTDPTKESSLAKYGYGDKYSATNVKARKNPDGTVVPASIPKLLPDGTFARPAGRQRKGMDWDSVKGIWFPIPGQQQEQED
ncbi:hypothetical protein ACHAXR_009885 [Thalassiosira sp. AJA248-18]